MCILDWYHASEHLHEYAKKPPRDDAARSAWAEQAKGTLYQQGAALLA